MLRLAITLAESALTDLQELSAWYADQGAPDVGRRLVTEIIEAIELLRDQPDLGRVVPEFNQSFLREIIHPPFRIVYRRDARRLRVVRVWRGERRLRLPPEGSNDR